MSVNGNGKLIIVNDSKGVGLVAGWNLSGATPRARLEAAFVAAGLDPTLIPSPPTPEAALGRATKSIQSKSVRVVKTPEGAYVVEDLRFDAAGLPVHTPRLVASIVGDNLYIASVRSEGTYQTLRALPPLVSVDPDPDAIRIRAEYQAVREELSTEDCSLWFSRLVRAHDAVRVLRREGGIYYLPPTTCDKWRTVTAAIAVGSGHSFGEIPAMKTDAAIKTIMDGLEADVRAEAAKIQEELERAVADADGAPGVRRLESRQRAALELGDKIKRYEAIFSTPAQAACDMLVKLRQNVDFSLRYALAKADGRDADAPRLLDLDERSVGDRPAPIEDNAPAVARFKHLELD